MARFCFKIAFICIGLGIAFLISLPESPAAIAFIVGAVWVCLGLLAPVVNLLKRKLS